MDVSVTVLWSMIIASCATAAGFFLLLGWPYRTTPAALVFAVLLASTGAVAYFELWLMQADTEAEYGTALRWAHVPVWMAILALVATIRITLRAGRLWLAWATCVVRTLALIINLASPVNINYHEIVDLEAVRFLGDYVVRAEGVPNPWMILAQIGLVLMIAFIADATHTTWRRGDPKRKRILAASILLFATCTSVQSVLSLWGVIDYPILITPFFLLVILATAADLSYGLLDINRWSARLRESEEYSSLATNAGGIGTWAWIIARDRFQGSNRWSDLIGLRRSAEYSCEQVLQRVHAEDRRNVRFALERTLAGSGEFSIEFRLLEPSQPSRWIEARGRLVTGANGRPDRILGVAADITERKSAEERLRALVEASPTGVLLVTKEGTITLVNSLVEALLDSRREELIGTSITSLLPEATQGDFKNAPSDAAANPNSSAGGSSREALLRRRNGTQFPVEITSKSVTIGEESLILVSIQDITLRRQTEQDLEQKRNELARMYRVTTLGELSGSLAHELNQPLSSILTNAQAARRFLSQEPPNIDEIRAIVNDIVAEDRRAGEIIRRLRRLLEKGDVQHHPVSLNAVAQEVLQLLRSDLSNRSIAAELDFDPHLPQTQGDHVQLQQVVLNLVLNAADAMSNVPIGDRVLTVRTAIGENDTIRLSVSDRGPGIAADALEDVFTPFYTTKRHGMGLGLAVCRNIVTAHHGQLWATTGEGQGATFTIALPRIANH